MEENFEEIKEIKQDLDNILNFLEPNVDKIKMELINSRVLIENNIEPYYSLYCFSKGGCDIKLCEEILCQDFPDCIERFYVLGYLNKKVNKNES